MTKTSTKMDDEDKSDSEDEEDKDEAVGFRLMKTDR